MASQRVFVLNFNLCHDKFDSLAVELGEVYSPREQEIMSGMLEIVLIDRVVYNTLDIEFIRPHGKFERGLIFG